MSSDESFNNFIGKDDVDTVWDDSELIKMYEESVKGNFDKKRKTTTASDEKSTTSGEKSQKPWKVGDICMAPYEELWYQAKIIYLHSNDKTAKVLFTEYNEELDVEIKDLFREDEVEYKNEDDTLAEVSAPEQKQPQPPTSKFGKFSGKYVIPVSHLIPPPPQFLSPITEEKEITSNMMISWYMNGYHTGYYQAMRDLQSKAPDAASSSQKH